jgi:hypothetical protein
MVDGEWVNSRWWIDGWMVGAQVMVADGWANGGWMRVGDGWYMDGWMVCVPENKLQGSLPRFANFLPKSASPSLAKDLNQ